MALLLLRLQRRPPADSWEQYLTYIDWHTGNTVHVCDYAYNIWKTPFCQGFGSCATPSVGVIGNNTSTVNPWYDQVVNYGVGSDTFFAGTTSMRSRRQPHSGVSRCLPGAITPSFSSNFLQSGLRSSRWQPSLCAPPSGTNVAKQRSGQPAQPRSRTGAFSFLAYFFFGLLFLAGIFRVSSSARLMSAVGGFLRQSPGTMT